MRKSLPLTLCLVALSLLPRCESAASSRIPASLTPPELTVRSADTGFQPYGFRGSVSVPLEIEVWNRADEELILERLNVETMGSGGLVIRPASSPFDTPIPPGQSRVVRLWATGVIDDPVFGTASHVNLRVLANFNSSLGRFRHVQVLQFRSGSSSPRRRG